MFLSDPLKSITVVTNATATTTEPSYSASYVDTIENGNKNYLDSLGALTGATAVAVVGVFPSGTRLREVKEIILFNRDTVSHTFTVKKLNDTTGYTIAQAVLGTLESMIYDGAKWTVYSAAGEVKSSALGAATSTAGVKNGSTVTCVESGTGELHKTVLTCTATPVTISDDANVAQYGGVKVYDFPEGMILTLGAMVQGTITAGVTGTIIDNWDGDVALGTITATTGATLVSTEATVLPSTPVSAGGADKIGVVLAKSAPTDLTESGARWIDGTTTPVDLFLNFVIDDDGTHTAGTAAFTGTITFSWINLGDL